MGQIIDMTEALAAPPIELTPVRTFAQRASTGHAECSATRYTWQGQRLEPSLGLSESIRVHFKALARLGALRSYVLYHQDQPAAFLYGWQWNGHFAYEEAAYDRALADFSPDRVLLHRVIEDLISNHCPEVVDFSYGDAPHKRSFSNHESASGPVVLAPRSLKTQVWSGLRHTREVVDRGMREILHRTGLYEHARRLYRNDSAG
jgi:CelD/BcsL family acetyltransferase involved in cellulose biosynthesis